MASRYDGIQRARERLFSQYPVAERVTHSVDNFLKVTLKALGLVLLLGLFWPLFQVAKLQLPSERDLPCALHSVDPGQTAREPLWVALGHCWHFHPSWACVPPAPVVLRAPVGVGAIPSRRSPRPLAWYCNLCFQNLLSSHSSGRCQDVLSLDWTRSSRSGQRRVKSETPDFGLGMANWSCVL